MFGPTHESLGSYATFVVALSLGALAIAVAWQLLSGHIRLRGLLYSDPRAGDVEMGPWSPGRAQLGLVTVGLAVWIVSAMSDPDTASGQPIDMDLILLFGGSQALYFADKRGGLRHAMSRLMEPPSQDR